MGYYPVLLDLAGRRCVMIGGGPVAERRVDGLVAAGAHVTVISPRLTRPLAALAAEDRIHHEPRGYREGDLAAADLAFVATDAGDVNAAVAREARERGLWINAADDPARCTFILPALVRRGDPRLLDEAPRARRIYAGKASGHHALPQERINALLIMHARRGRRVVRLKGGDPFVFGRGGEEAEALAGARIPFEIVPGVSSAVAVPAYAGIPLTHRGVASSFTVVTGHGSGSGGESSVDWARLARSSDTLVVLMGLESLSRIARALIAHGRPATTPVALVRWGTTSAQETVTGTLRDIAARAARARLEPPVVIVIGDVVALRDRLQWFDDNRVPMEIAQ